MTNAKSYLSHIRGIEVHPGEEVVATLDAAQGMTSEPTASGRLLVATNRRLLSLMEEGSTQVVQMYAIGTVSGASVRNDARRGLSWRQWVSLALGGLAAYLILAYWLVDRLPNVIIPVVNLHAVAAALMLLVILVGWLIWRGLSDSGGNVVRIDGLNWTLEFASEADNTDLIAFSSVLLELQRNAYVPPARPASNEPLHADVQSP